MLYGHEWFVRCSSNASLFYYKSDWPATSRTDAEVARGQARKRGRKGNSTLRVTCFCPSNGAIKTLWARTAEEKGGKFIKQVKLASRLTSCLHFCFPSLSISPPPPPARPPWRSSHCKYRAKLISCSKQVIPINGDERSEASVGSLIGTVCGSL